MDSERFNHQSPPMRLSDHPRLHEWHYIALSQSISETILGAFSFISWRLLKTRKPLLVQGLDYILSHYCSSWPASLMALATL